MLITERLKSIGNTSSTSEKIRLLTEYNTVVLREIILYTYNTSWRYHIKNIPEPMPWELADPQAFRHLDTHWDEVKKVLNQLKSKLVTGKAAKTAVASLLYGFSVADQEVIKNILSRDLRIGVNKTTIDKVFPGLIYTLKFMKAEVYEFGTFSRYKKLYMSIKYDFIRGLARQGDIFTSGGLSVKGIDHIKAAIPMINGTYIDLDMEITIPGMEFNKASGLIRSAKACPEAVGMVFDIPSCNGTFEERYEYLCWLFANDILKEPFKLVKHVHAKTEEHITRNFEKAVSGGYEGLVIKTADGLYVNKRSNQWLKVKACDPEDAKIVGFVEGTGKYVGTLGAVIIKRAKNGVLVRVGGFPDDWKHEIWNNKQKYLDTTISVKYHEETPDGSLRSPRFYRERWDKDRPR